MGRSHGETELSMLILANVIESAFSPLIHFFEAILVAIHGVIGGSWGWSIIGLTLIVRLVTAPLTVRQFKAMAQLRAHAPELKKIQERYKDDRRRMQEEQMKYYKEAGVNPLASCLPLLLQAPVFISLVYMLRTDLKSHICGSALHAWNAAHPKLHYTLTTVPCNKLVPHSASFLFVNDITSKATGLTLVVLMVLYVGTMVTTSVMMSVGVDAKQRLMTIALPVVFVIFVIQFPAGLLVYWIATNITLIPQQYFNIRRYGRPADQLKAATAANGRGSPSAAKQAIKEPAEAVAKPAGGAGKGTPAATKKPAAPPPRARPRRKRSGRRR
jgi:YidC/Oxa1 family membrane protein insertase